MDKKRTVGKKTMMKVGDRVMAVCGEDPGKGIVEVFGCGVYEGEFIPVEAVGVIGRLLRDNKRTNPRIRLDNGGVVYGCECWWGPIEKVQKRLAGKKCVEVRIEDKRKEVEG
jgi:hypothetical protein